MSRGKVRRLEEAVVNLEKQMRTSAYPKKTTDYGEEGARRQGSQPRDGYRKGKDLHPEWLASSAPSVSEKLEKLSVSAEMKRELSK